MRLLLDTHALVWWLGDDARLSSRARTTIADPDTDVHVSAASAWEIATKVRLGKWHEVRELTEDFEETMARERFALLSITVRHAHLAGSLRAAHRDPFDRVLAAQSLNDAMPLVTADPAFRGVDVEVVW